MAIRANAQPPRRQGNWQNKVLARVVLEALGYNPSKHFSRITAPIFFRLALKDHLCPPDILHAALDRAGLPEVSAGGGCCYRLSCAEAQRGHGAAAACASYVVKRGDRGIGQLLLFVCHDERCCTGTVHTQQQPRSVSRLHCCSCHSSAHSCARACSLSTRSSSAT